MSTLVGTNGQAVTPSTPPARLHIPVHEEEYRQARTLITQALQVTLDLNIILELFFEHLQNLIPFQGLLYSHREQEFQSLVGKEQVHRASYTMATTAQENLGEIVFSRNKRFREDELIALEYVLTALTCPLRNALQYREAIRMAMRDALTGVGNRKAMENSLQREIQLAYRYAQPLSLVVIDIDHFKHINDEFGHLVGDVVLKEIAQSIQAVSRLTDLTFRYGGEEFVVVLNKTPAGGAAVIAERLRHFIENQRIEANGHLIRATISVGCATLQAQDDSQSLFARADDALYDAKRQGRNQVVSG